MIIGVTGTFASGKTTVAELIAKSKNSLLLNADKMVHSIYDNDADMHRQIVAEFGRGILAKNNKIDRKKLSIQVFSDRDKLKKLGSIVHPKVIKETKQSVKSFLKDNKNKDVVIDAPLLIEVRLGGFCDKVIVVTSSIDNILERAKKFYGLEKNEVLKRVRSQMPISEKKKHADFIINNDNSLKKLEIKVKELLDKIR